MCLKRSLKVVDSMGHISGLVATPLVGVLVILVSLEVVKRYFFNSPTTWSYELCGYLFAACSLLAGAYCYRHEQMIKMDLLYNRWPPKIKSWVDIVTAAIAFVFLGFLTVKGGTFFWDAWQAQMTSGTVWNPLVWPYRLCLPVASMLLLLQVIAKFVRDIYIVSTGKVLS